MRLWPDGDSTVPVVTAEYGIPHPVTGYHRGIDLIGWSVIRAADAGVVIFAGWNGTAGIEVKILHDDGYITRYLHLATFYVWNGQRVGLAEDLGIMGATGEVTGLHLHFEVIAPDGVTRINPRDYVGEAPPPPQPIPEDQLMAYSLVPATDGHIYITSLVTGRRTRVGSTYDVTLLERVKDNDGTDKMLTAELDIARKYIDAVNAPTSTSTASVVRGGAIALLVVLLALVAVSRRSG